MNMLVAQSIESFGFESRSVGDQRASDLCACPGDWAASPCMEVRYLNHEARQLTARSPELAGAEAETPVAAFGSLRFKKLLPRVRR